MSYEEHMQKAIDQVRAATTCLMAAHKEVKLAGQRPAGPPTAGLETALTSVLTSFNFLCKTVVDLW